MKKVLLIIAELIVAAFCKVTARENPTAGLIIMAACIVIGVCIFIFADKTKNENDIDYDIVDGKKPFGDRSRKEYLLIHAPNNIIKICNEPQRRDDLAARLQPYVKSRQINKRMAKALVEEFGINQ